MAGRVLALRYEDGKGGEKGRRLQSCDIPQMFVGLGWLRSKNAASASSLYTSSAQQQQQQSVQRRPPISGCFALVDTVTFGPSQTWICAIWCSRLLRSTACKHVLTSPASQHINKQCVWDQSLEQPASPNNIIYYEYETVEEL